MDEIKRLTPVQRARCNRLIRRLCANYDGGNCLPLDDGEGYVCVQMISYSLLCKYFRRAVLPADKALYADILPAAHTDLRPMRKALCSRQQPAEVLPGMRPHHPVQAEGGLGQAAAQRRTLSAEKALISKAFWISKRVRANYLTSAFPKFLEDHGLRRIRFHDLRHSCASLLLANGVPLKHIQEWLGHSDFTTTANIYAHLDYKSKITSAQAMETGLALPEGGDFGSRWREG